MKAKFVLIFLFFQVLSSCLENTTPISSKGNEKSFINIKISKNNFDDILQVVWEYNVNSLNSGNIGYISKSQKIMDIQVKDQRRISKFLIRIFEYHGYDTYNFDGSNSTQIVSTAICDDLYYELDNGSLSFTSIKDDFAYGTFSFIYFADDNNKLWLSGDFGIPIIY